MPQLVIRLLRGLRTEHASGHPLLIRRRKARALLAYLALRPGSEHSREALAGLLWPAMTEEHARHNLRQTLLALRQALPMAPFAREGDMIGLDPAAVAVDVVAFERSVQSGTSDGLREAAALYQGDLLDGFSIDEPAFDGWVAGERQRLRELALVGLDKLLAVDLAAGALERAVQTALRLVALDPLRESAHRVLMELHARQGQRAAALRQYQICVEILRRELGVRPEEATTRFYQQILRNERRDRPAEPTATAGPVTLPVPATHYARSGGVNIAYQCIGQGPPDLVLVPGWVSNVECFWEEPRVERFLRRLSSFARLILFDKRGTGLSDRVAETSLPTLEQRMDDLRAVMDATRSERAVVVGYSEGGLMCALFAATYPERTLGLVMIGSYPRRTRSPDFPWGYPPEDYPRYIEELVRHWGEPVTLDQRAPSAMHDEAYARWWARFLRMGASPGAARALTELNLELDVRHVLPAIRVPTLLLHAVGDQTIDVNCSRYMAARIPHARHVELPSADHLPWLSDADVIVDEIARFAAMSGSAAESDRLLVTTMAVELMRGQAGADEPADARFQEVVRVDTVRFRGRLLAAAGGRVLAAFDGPARAVRCAEAIVDDLRRLGLTARSGLHTGECEVGPGGLGGVAVEAARDIAATACGGEVLVSGTVKDLVAGSGLEFASGAVQDRAAAPRAARARDGLDELQLFALASRAARPAR